MRSLPEFVIIALLVTLTPGPATATVQRVAARDGRTVARGTILGNSTGVLIWGVLSAAGVTSLILASQVAFDVLRGSPVLPYALGKAATVVVLDVVWFSALTYAMDKAKTLLRPRVQSVMERVTGAVMIGLGVRLALESR